MSEVALQLQGVDKFYGKLDVGIPAVKNLSMSVDKGDIVALLGSSGCGKTTTLRMVAGFEKVSRGAILINDRPIHDLAPAQRNVAMAFEGYSLYPTVTIGENIAFALKAVQLSKDEIASRVAAVADMLEISDILERYPMSVSGGQQQRASLARALVRPADLHLLDEPMGQLEPQLRTLLRGRVKHFIKEQGLTAILVTHDQTEANALADKIAVMEAGVLQQYSSPDEIRDCPANLFTGTFVGEPPMNVLKANILKANVLKASPSKTGQGIAFKLQDETVLEYAADEFSNATLEHLKNYSDVIIGIRPYAIQPSTKGPKAKVITNQWLGDQSHIEVKFAGSFVILVEHDKSQLQEGQEIGLKLDPASFHIFDPESGQALGHDAGAVSG